MSRMFKMATSFNQPLNNWDMSNVLNVEEMLMEATSFNQRLDDWDDSNILNFGWIYG